MFSLKRFFSYLIFITTEVGWNMKVSNVINDKGEKFCLSKVSQFTHIHSLTKKKKKRKERIKQR